ncbi:MAG: hypothetical protein JG776_2189 [Caloramator sp.]|jgi:hypothetical protein|uniref:hypothetical protein n=1 Tax=Caloramator sp. TaxID=1871330 RepID=UPI001D9F8C1B|nr:hypothetical protein [Caloramator sp.]MBZ4664471.1 hypothetical protein [Caloramator sp.]
MTANLIDFVKSLNKYIQKLIGEAKYNKTEFGVIIGTNQDGSYKVKINDNIHNIYAVEGLNLAVNDIVLIEIANNNFSFKYIKCKRPKLNDY